MHKSKPAPRNGLEAEELLEQAQNDEIPAEARLQSLQKYIKFVQSEQTTEEISE